MEEHRPKGLSKDKSRTAWWKVQEQHSHAVGKAHHVVWSCRKQKDSHDSFVMGRNVGERFVWEERVRPRTQEWKQFRYELLISLQTAWCGKIDDDIRGITYDRL